MNTNTWNKQTKQHWIDTMQAHQDADRLVQGRWWNDDDGEFRGCFFGCAMQTEHNALEKATKEMHLPPWLVHLAEKIFEELPKEDALVFPVQLCEAIPTDTNITPVLHKLAIKRLAPLAKANHEVAPAIEGVIRCHEKALAGDSDIDWSAAESAAESARSARSAAWSAQSAAWSASESAAESAAESAESAARSAAESAESAAWSAESAAWSARSAAWQTERDNLLELLRAHKLDE